MGYALDLGDVRVLSRIVVNSSGLHADLMSRSLGVEAPSVWACRGEYFVLDRRLEGVIRTLIYQVPGPNDPGIGIHLTPTVDGNVLIGPSADYIPSEDRESYRVTPGGMEELNKEASRLLPGMNSSDFIRSFAGNRPKLTPPEVGGNADFLIEEPHDFPGFIHLLGMESPGLTSSPAIADSVRKLISKRLELIPKSHLRRSYRPFTGRFADLPSEERKRLAREIPDYAEIVCRCESITKREIRDAIENKIGSRSLSGIKYRARAMMGRCQGGFCLTRIARILREDYGYAPEEFITGLRGSRPQTAEFERGDRS
jgi:glycerol-3-phosphate dehydrogenase